MGSSTLIRIRALIKTFDMGSEKVHAVNGVDLDVAENEYVALMGPSGSGKTTLMNIIGCLDTPTSGTYELDGQDVTSLHDDRLAHIRNRKIGFVFQTFNLLPRATAFKNVELPLIYAGLGSAERAERVWQALRLVNLEDRAQHRPNELSGGQCQRVAIARAIVNRPALILADEPTGNLDSRTEAEIMGVMGELHERGNTIIVVTHEDSVARLSKRVIRLRDGKVESDAPARRHPANQGGESL